MPTSEQFVRDLESEVQSAIARIGTASAAGAPAEGVTIAKLLEVALKNELEASEEAAAWMTSERDVEVKLALARQCGDEAKHYRLIEARLRALGVDVAAIDPLAGGPTPIYSLLRGLETTVERVAAGPFAREALAQIRNEVFIAYCRAEGDEETARLYEETIQPDEAHHHRLGRSLLVRLATDEAAQALARAAAMRTLQLGEEQQEIARLKKGIARAPGC
jgi:bacterioferritin (cytochrome b1)